MNNSKKRVLTVFTFVIIIYTIFVSIVEKSFSFMALGSGILFSLIVLIGTQLVFKFGFKLDKDNINKIEPADFKFNKKDKK